MKKIMCNGISCCPLACTTFEWSIYELSKCIAGICNFALTQRERHVRTNQILNLSSLSWIGNFMFARRSRADIDSMEHLRWARGCGECASFLLSYMIPIPIVRRERGFQSCRLDFRCDSVWLGAKFYSLLVASERFCEVVDLGENSLLVTQFASGMLCMSR